MNTGKTLFAQVMEFIPWSSFSRIVSRYRGDARVRSLSAAEHFRVTASVPLTDLPDALRRKLPRYGAVPAIRMGRLAIDGVLKGRGLGGALLADALCRAIAAEIPGAVLIVDAKDAKAAAFYRHHGFIELGRDPLQLFLPLATAKAATKP